MLKIKKEFKLDEEYLEFLCNKEGYDIREVKRGNYIIPVIFEKGSLEKILKNSGYTIASIAKKLNLSNTFLYKCRNGYKTMSEKHWLEIQKLIKQEKPFLKNNN